MGRNPLVQCEPVKSPLLAVQLRQWCRARPRVAVGLLGNSGSSTQTAKRDIVARQVIAIPRRVGEPH